MTSKANSELTVETQDEPTGHPGEVPQHSRNRRSAPPLDGATKFTPPFIGHHVSTVPLDHGIGFAWAVSDMNNDDSVDVVAAKIRNTAGSAEVHVLGGSKGYGELAGQHPVDIALDEPDDLSHTVGDANRDRRDNVFTVKKQYKVHGGFTYVTGDGAASVIAVKTRNTPPGKMKVHVLGTS